MTASEATPGAQPARAADRGEDGIATLVFPLVMWIAVVAAIAIVDVTAYLVAGARAQQLADAAALAAVTVDADPADGVARWVPAAGGDARLAAQRSASPPPATVGSRCAPASAAASRPRCGSACRCRGW